MKVQMIHRAIPVAIMTVLLGVIPAMATVILQDDFTGAANSNPDGAKWGYSAPAPNPRVFLNGSGQLKMDADVAPFGPYLNALGGGPGSNGLLPNGTLYARLTITGLNHTLGGFASAGLSTDPGNNTAASEIMLRSSATPHVWYLRVAGGGDGASWNTDIGKTASTGDWVLEWYQNRVLVYYNGDLKVDTNNAPTSTEGASWAFPSSAAAPFISKYGGDSLTVNAIAWESIAVPEPASLALIGAGALMLRRRRD